MRTIIIDEGPRGKSGSDGHLDLAGAYEWRRAAPFEERARGVSSLALAEPPACRSRWKKCRMSGGIKRKALQKNRNERYQTVRPGARLKSCARVEVGLELSVPYRRV